MDIFTYLKRDHRKVAAMMDDILSIRLPIIRMNIFRQIRADLLVHATAEEQTFYTAIEAAAGEPLRERMGHSVDEHNKIRDLLDLLDTTPIAGDFWLEKFHELKQAVTQHVAEEENDIFPRARALLSPAQARQLAKDMDAMKPQLLQDMELNIPAL